MSTASTAKLRAALSGRYAIERELGAGGMATVYLADDLRHRRKVALKVLRPELAAVIGADRFLQEITTTANLQHPHILPLHDSGEVDGTVFYVMPFVDGESLRDRISRQKQLPIPEAVRITTEIASALDYAHRRGVIHRDIKPENILIHEGQALIADFGIALAVSRADGGSRMTETGMSLGTPHYMSPEQATGERDIDARSDVYALGCVLFEMLTGEPPFTGPTAQSIIAKVMTEKPASVVVRRDTVPPHVGAAVQTALQKLPADRFATAAEFAAALATPSTSSVFPTVSTTVSAPSTRRSLTATLMHPMSIVGVAGVLFGLAAWLWPSLESPLERMYLELPPLEVATGGASSFALSPDAFATAYIGRNSEGTQLYVKRRGELNGVAIEGTEGALSPFFSPDGEWIAFFADKKLKKVRASGDGVTPIADAEYFWGAWLEDGRIAYVTTGYALSIVNSAGGKPEVLLDNAGLSGRAAVGPVALPGSDYLLFSACTQACAESSVFAINLRTRERHEVLASGFAFAYATTGHLIWGVLASPRTAINAIVLDARSARVRGESMPLVDESVGWLALSPNGTLLYNEGSRGGGAELMSVSRSGVATPIDSTWVGGFVGLGLSRDGRRIAASVVTDGKTDVWTKTVAGGPPVKLTFADGQMMRPEWSGDGEWILYTRVKGDTSTLYRKRANGSGNAELIRNGVTISLEVTTTRNDEWLITRTSMGENGRDLYALRRGDTTSRPLVATKADEYAPVISPDGRWLAYVSNGTGRGEVYVRPFPDVDAAQFQVTTTGAGEPKWSSDGRELFFVTSKNELAVVSVATTPTFTNGRQQSLFSVAGYERDQTHSFYAPLADGRGFIMVRARPATFERLVLVENWFQELRAKVK